jgi:hypothetical protein
MSELGIAPNTTVGRRIDDLTRALDTLTIEDDAREVIKSHLRELKRETARPLKIKDLIVFDPAKQKLRGWLTAADNFVYNQRLDGEENKVRVIGSYLRELAWDWFEPILNEANNTPRTEWEDRTRRIMGNYREFKKALGKVFGQIDERRTAAEKLARLRQTASVTLYITEFQTITSSLDWDDEALEDKFLEGLKQEIRQALIYYSEEPKDLDELFERTQRIDHELKKNREASHFQRRPFTGAGRGSYVRGPFVKKDGEGDVVMKGAKVDMEKAKRERLCFHCGKPGHQAKFCRARKREAGKNERTIRMLRTGIIEEDVSELLGNLDDKDLTSQLSNSMTTSDEEDSKPDELEGPTNDYEISETLERRIQDWRKDARSAVAVTKRRGNMRYTRGGRTPLLRKERPRYTGEWPYEHNSRPLAMTKGVAQEVGKVQAYPSTTNKVEKSLQEEEELRCHEDTKGLGSSGKYDFEELLETRAMPWKERVGYFDDKPINKIKEAKWEAEICNCYSFKVCWAFTGETWSEHLEGCIECEEWEERECLVPGHDQVSKRLLLNDLSTRRHVTELTLEKKGHGNCCIDGICLHEFITHAHRKVPWWACFGDSCEIHMAQKTKSQQLPQIPYVAIMNAQKCPCLRRGCRCNYDNKHPYHDALLSSPTNTNIIEALNETIERLEKHRKEGEELVHGLKCEVYRIRQTKTRTGKQMSTKVKVGKETITAIIDSGADINYANKDWCDERKIPYKMAGWGWVKSYKGEKTRTKILEANIKLKVQGKFSRTRFTILEETGEDQLVLGDPWLTEQNPDIDWKKRTLRFRRRPEESKEKRAPYLRVVDSRTFEHMESPWIDYSEESHAAMKTKKEVKKLEKIHEEENEHTAELDGQKDVKELEAKEKEHSKEYLAELEEIRKKLPDEIKEFASIFCSED